MFKGVAETGKINAKDPWYKVMSVTDLRRRLNLSPTAKHQGRKIMYPGFILMTDEERLAWIWLEETLP